MDDPTRLTREELYEKVWSEPVSVLAKRYGLSDVGLKKICKRHDIPTPWFAYSTHRDHFVQAIVITRSSDRDRSEATLGTSVS